jgi:hypothetical protein
MITRASASASASNDENEDLPTSFIRFVNCKNDGLATLDLIHQFEEMNFLTSLLCQALRRLFTLENSFTQILAHRATS